MTHLLIIVGREGLDVEACVTTFPLMLLLLLLLLTLALSTDIGANVPIQGASLTWEDSDAWGCPSADAAVSRAREDVEGAKLGNEFSTASAAAAMLAFAWAMATRVLSSRSLLRPASGSAVSGTAELADSFTVAAACT